MLVEGWTREYAAGGFWRGGETIGVNWVEPAAYERTRNEGIWEGRLERDERGTAQTYEKWVEREKMTAQQPTLVCFYTLPGSSLAVGPGQGHRNGNGCGC